MSCPHYRRLHLRPVTNVDRWVSLVRGRSNQIGTSTDADTGEEFTTCGDLRLDNEVAKFVLEPVDRDCRSGVAVRKTAVGLRPDQRHPQPPRSCVRFPFCCFPSTGRIRSRVLMAGGLLRDACAGTRCANRNCVGRLRRDWGCTDLAIRMCRSIGTPEWGTKKIIASWWRRGCGIMRPWDMFWSPGLISDARARQWRKEVFGSPNKYESEPPSNSRLRSRSSVRSRVSRPPRPQTISLCPREAIT